LGKLEHHNQSALPWNKEQKLNMRRILMLVMTQTLEENVNEQIFVVNRFVPSNSRLTA
jgi:hypothetical protein